MWVVIREANIKYLFREIPKNRVEKGLKGG